MLAERRSVEQSQVGWYGRGKEMEEVVIDTSVAVKWFSNDEDTDKALKLRDRHVNINSQIELVHYFRTNNRGFTYQGSGDCF